MLVNMCDILKKSREGRYGVVAPNICNEDTARAAIEVAEENRAPLILDVIFNVNPDIPLFAHICGKLARKASVPVALNLDHGGSIQEKLDGILPGLLPFVLMMGVYSYFEKGGKYLRLIIITLVACLVGAFLGIV